MSQNNQSIASNPEFNKNMAGLPLSQYRAVAALVDAQILAVRAAVMEELAQLAESWNSHGELIAAEIRARATQPTTRIETDFDKTN